MSATELNWSKSSYSGSDGDHCVEVAAAPAAVHVRDSKDTTLPHLTASRDAWQYFLRSRPLSELDL